MVREILDSRLRGNDTSKGRNPDRWGVEDDTPSGLVVGNGLQAQIGTDGVRRCWVGRRLRRPA